MLITCQNTSYTTRKYKIIQQLKKNKQAENNSRQSYISFFYCFVLMGFVLWTNSFCLI